MRKLLFLLIPVIAIGLSGCASTKTKSGTCPTTGPSKTKKTDIKGRVADLENKVDELSQQQAQAVTVSQAQQSYPAAKPSYQSNVTTGSSSSSDTLSKKEIQTALKNAGYYTGNIDGVAGPMTQQAIKDFQSANGLKSDGVVGPKTTSALKKYL